MWEDVMAVTTAPETASTAAPARVKTGKTSLWTRFAYGVGAGAIGVKDNGFSYFLLMFYSQVVGLDARLVGVALTVALVVDAFVDPIVGYWSDNVRTRWGRRHPFMYAAALPLAASYFLLWNPPLAWSSSGKFAYLLAMAVGIRLCVSLYQVPSGALAAELTDDYDERSALLSYRSYFGWTTGNTMSVLMFMLIFPALATGGFASGQFNPASYRLYGIIASALLLATILISAIGTHSRIPYLKAPPPPRRLTIGKIFGEIFETLSNRSFIALFLSTGFNTVAAGLSASLAFYWLTYFWRFPPRLSGWITVAVFGSAVLGALLAPVVSRAMGKKKAAITIGLLAFLGSPLPIVLRLTGILPEGSPWTFPVVLMNTLFDVSLIITYEILGYSMMADLVEQSELKTGRRSEGIFASAITFTQKLVNGVGLMLAGFVLTLAGVKTGADASHVSVAAVTRLGEIYVPTILSLWMAMLAVIGFYAISRTSHAETLKTLEARRGER
jgi:GPH family glycoside/pentoside/hexuronide:cation symporter